jgi:dihydroorotase
MAPESAYSSGYVSATPAQGTITLVKQPLLIPESYSFGEGVVVPMWAVEEMRWQVQGDQHS